MVKLDPNYAYYAKHNIESDDMNFNSYNINKNKNKNNIQTEDEQLRYILEKSKFER
jgi:hypothetical protein